MNLAGFDLETRGVENEYALQPWRTYTQEASITSYALIGDGLKEIVKDPSPAQLRSVLTTAIDNDLTLVGANVVFDVAWLLAQGLEDEVFACKWMDMILLWKRCDGLRYTYGLKEGVKIFLPQYDGYDKGVDFNDESPEAIAKRLNYNALDSAFTKYLADKFWKELAPLERRAAQIEARGIPDIAQSWLDGITMSRDNLIQLEHRVNKEWLDSMYALNEKLIQGGLPEVTDDQLGSPAKLGQVLFDTWGLEPVKYTPSGNPSTDKESLIKLAVMDEKVNLVRKVRKARNRLAKFVMSPLKSIDYNPDGKTHPMPRIAGTYTGRMTYSSKQGKGKNERQTGIALHQWERDPSIRQSIQAPEGYVVVEYDFSGQEMRLMSDRVAVLTGDTTMLDLFLNGEDLHAYMGAEIKQLDYEIMRATYETDKAMKQGRYLGKFANLSLQYRVGIDTMRARALTEYDLWLSAQDAEHIKSTYLSTYPGISLYWSAAMQMARQQGYAETMGGRRIMLNNMREWDQQQKAINTPIQGTGADMKQLAIAVASPLWRKMDSKYLFDLHDAVFLLMPDNSELDSNTAELKHVLSNLPYKKVWGWEPLLSLPVDGSVGYRWGDMRGVK